MTDVALAADTSIHHAQPKWMLWAGRAVSALPVLALVASGAMKLTRAPELLESFTGKFGYQASALTTLAIVELACALLYAVPQTAVLGAVLVTGYLGGAIATHVRVEDAFIAPLVLGVLAWLGLFLRDARVRALLPVRALRDQHDTRSTPARTAGAIPAP